MTITPKIKKVIVAVIFAGVLLMTLSYVESERQRENFEKFHIFIKGEVKHTAYVGRLRIKDDKERVVNEQEENALKRANSIEVRKEIEEARRIKREKEEAERRERERKRNRTTANYSSGGHLTRSNGVYYFGNQRETYYNLDMSWVVKYAHQNGIQGEYWVREDGCKMLGNYIILACNRSVHPYGSIVLTSLGYGRSLDTGSFAYTYPYGVDIAVNW